MMGFEGSQSKLTARGLPNSVLFGAMGIVTDLTVPDVRLGLRGR